MADEPLLTLEEWRHQRFSFPPCVATVRQWIKHGYIDPPPVKHGRSYYIQPGAIYQGKPTS